MRIMKRERELMDEISSFFGVAKRKFECCCT